MNEQPRPHDAAPLALPPDPAFAESPHEGVGLCLSGGGYRAMLFHLGSLWRLNEAGWLPRLTRVASVSGGSIAAGVLGVAWRRLAFEGGVATNFATEVAEPILSFAGRTVDIPSALLGLLSGGAGRRVAAAYDRHLFHGATLQALPGDGEGPLFVYLATDLSNGVLCQFARPYLRNYLSYDIAEPTVPLATAVAASSAFPPFLSPIRLDLPGGRTVTLTDGGVYDNLGLEPVLKYVDTIFVSDGGGPFEVQERPRTDWLLGTVRVLITIQAKVGDLRRLQVVKGLATKRRRGGFWAIDTDPLDFERRAGTLPITRAQAEALAATPTRLAALPLAQRHRLVNWGYAAADACLRTYVDGNLPEPAGFPLPDGVGDA